MVSCDVGSCSRFLSDVQMTLSLPGTPCALVYDLLLVVTSSYHSGVPGEPKIFIAWRGFQYTRGQLRSIETILRVVDTEKEAEGLRERKWDRGT